MQLDEIIAEMKGSFFAPEHITPVLYYVWLVKFAKIGERTEEMFSLMFRARFECRMKQALFACYKLA